MGAAAAIPNLGAERAAKQAVRDRYGAGAFGIYVALSVAFFGRGLIGHFDTAHVGKAVGDPALVAWFLQWVAHTSVHRVNPLYTGLSKATGKKLPRLEFRPRI